MSVKRAFFGIFQKIMVVCCAMFFGITHAFSANLPSGYTELEYIQSSGTQYINTGFAPTANYKHTIVFETLSSGTGYLCGTGSAGGRSGNVKLTGNNILDIYNNDSGTGAAGILGNVQLAQGKNTLVLDLRNASKSYVSLNGVNLETTNTNTYIKSSLSVTLFGSGGANSVPLRIYESIIEQNGVVIAHFVPAKNSSGVIGMYDLHKKAFYTNAGTGEFTAGRAVCSNGELAQTYTSATGTVTQSGTPTPTNPIEPTFYQQGYLVLRKINDTYADSYDATTGKITRRVGVKVLNGTENWFSSGDNYLGYMYNLLINDMYAEASSVSSNRASPYSTHFGRSTSWLSYDVNARLNKVQAYTTTDNSKHILGLGYPGAAESNISAFKQWLVQQYAAGTPVVVYYPLTTPVEENWAPEQCLNGIKIATTAYNTARFSPVVNDLNSTIATIRSVVTNTINQTKAIADLQAKKQTRPDEQCPAGKKCLLVEDNDGVPHWYEIIENVYGLPAGYTPLEYIRSSGVAYIDTGYSPTSKTRIELVAKMDSGAGNVNIAGSAISSSSGSSSDALLVINSYTDTEYEIKFGPSGTWVHNPTNMTTKNTFSLSATEFRVNDVVKETYSGSVPDTGNKPFYLFQRWRSEITSTNSKVQIYEFNIYENGTLVRRMVPAKQGTTVGMYDTVGNRFYTKSGTGSLTAGPEI